MTRHRSNAPGDDPNLRELVAAETPVVTIFGKSWLLHVTEVLGASPTENLDMIADSIGFVVDRGREAVYDAEHFFDGYRDDRDYALSTLRAARQAGARTLVLCDTNGGTLTDELVAIIGDVRGTLDGDPDAPAVTWGIHTHNDAELAVANSMAAVAAGIRHVQATINGYGERAGNANMVSILANLALKTPHVLVPAGGGDLAGLTDLSRSVAEIANQTPNDYQPYVGRSAFAHKGGVHGAAVAKVERSYQHIDPAAVGNAGRLVVSELGGRANTSIRARQLGLELEGVVDPRELSNLIKELEADGLAFEGAEASFELLIRRHAADYAAPFRIVDYTCLIEQRDGRELLAEATVKVEVEGEILHTAADGNGPVNALDAALRKALSAFYPGLDEVHLVDYKVRILDGGAATAARTRVVIDSMDGARTWSTMGSDTNIIAASASALADSLEYAIWKSGSELRRRDERQFTTATTPTPRPTRPAARPRPHGGDPMTDLADALELSRWTASSGSNARSRGAVVIASGDHVWRASAEGIGAIDALYRAVDEALVGVLTGHPRLLAYDIHALGEGTDTIGAVTVRIAPPDVGGERGQRRVPGRGARAEHHRGLDRGVHRGDQPDAGRGALVGGDRGGRAIGAASRSRPARRASSGPTSTRRRSRRTRRPGSSGSLRAGGVGSSASVGPRVIARRSTQPTSGRGTSRVIVGRSERPTGTGDASFLSAGRSG